MTQSHSYKTEQLMLYICTKLAGDPSFGSVKLNKVLYYIDNISYLRYNAPISIFNYVKQPAGPTPKPSQFIPLRERMIRDGVLEITEKELITGMVLKKPNNLKAPDLYVFTTEEIVFIDAVIDLIKPLSAKSISDISHEKIAWQIAENGEDLPFFTFLLSEADIDEQDVEISKSRIGQYISKRAIKE